MSKKQELENQISKDMEAIAEINKKQEELCKKISDNNDKMTDCQRKKSMQNESLNKIYKPVAISLLAVLATMFVLLMFQKLDIAVVLFGIYGLFAIGACIPSIASLIVNTIKLNKYREQNDNYAKECKNLDNEKIKINEHINILQKELNDLVIIENKNTTRQNLQSAKVLHSKEFKQFKNYLKYKNSKTEQSTEQTTSNELEIKM